MAEKEKKAKKGAIKKDKKEGKPVSGKKDRTEVNFILLIVFVLGILAVMLIGVKLLAKPEIISIDDLHQKNIEGKLAPEKGYMYNGFSFVYANGMWFTRIKNLDENMVYNIQLHYGPKQVQNISIEGDILQFREFNGTYITFDPLGADLSHVALSASELSINLANFFNMMVVSACTKNETNICNIRDIVTCENNDQNPIIYVEESEDMGIVQDGNCIRIKGNGLELTREVDRLLYMWLGIM